MVDAPSLENHYHADHIQLVLQSHFNLTKQALIADQIDIVARARAVWEAPFALVSHNIMPDPVFNYANHIALELFEMTWSEFTALPSRMSAEPIHHDERERLMTDVRKRGFISDYQGIRIAKSGKRFLIERATVWNIIDPQGKVRGQAAVFDHWTELK